MHRFLFFFDLCCRDHRRIQQRDHLRIDHVSEQVIAIFQLFLFRGLRQNAQFQPLLGILDLVYTILFAMEHHSVHRVRDLFHLTLCKTASDDIHRIFPCHPFGQNNGSLVTSRIKHLAVSAFTAQRSIKKRHCRTEQNQLHKIQNSRAAQHHCKKHEKCQRRTIRDQQFLFHRLQNDLNLRFLCKENM